MQQTDAQLRALEKLASGELRRALDGSAVWRTADAVKCELAGDLSDDLEDEDQEEAA